MEESVHIFKGLRRDNHQIRQSKEFLWDAHNIRLTNRDDSTLLSITNERGTKYVLTLRTFYVGHCVLGNYLVIFTANDDSSDARIYRIEKKGDTFEVIILFHYDDVWLESWNPNYPIETLGYYETDLCQKVYWIDGINQPRVINIVKPELRIPRNKQSTIIIDGTNFSYPSQSTSESAANELMQLFPEGLYNKDSFDFIRTLNLRETVNVEKLYSQGEFSPGTIQYAFSYYDKYEQESNIFYTTPLYYISYNDRGGSPEDKIANSFRISITNADTRFEFIRVYSIHRTSIDATPTVKVVRDINIVNDETIVMVDTGNIGYTIDASSLLYIGGESIVANCITQKDNTLFLGNITVQSNTKQKELKETIGNNFTIEDFDLVSTTSTTSTTSTYYYYKPNLNGAYPAKFKAFEKYRCGIQAQYSNGKWSDPIFIGDYILCNHYVWETLPTISSKAIRIDRALVESLRKLGIKRIRTCIVFPKTGERDVICQGVLCPTVYSVSGRRNDSPYSISSWFFRPSIDMSGVDNSKDVYHGSSIEFRHNHALKAGPDRGAEIQNMLPGKTMLSDITSDNVDEYQSHFFVDENIVTFHSPDVEFDSSIQNFIWDNVRLKIIGVAKLRAISGDIDIQTSSPTANSNARGLVHTSVGYQTHNNYYVNGGLIMGGFYEDSAVGSNGDNPYSLSPGTFRFAIYPWHRTGSLNNDSNRGDGSVRTSVLSKKVISNLKFFDDNDDLDGTDYLYYNIETPKLFNSNELNLIQLEPSFLRKKVPYMGNVDTLLSNGGKYKFYISNGFSLNFEESQPFGNVTTSLDPVRMKYKSSPHLVFSLGNSSTTIELLPRHRTIGNTSYGEFTFPDWQQSGSSDGSNNDKEEYNGILWMILANATVTGVMPSSDIPDNKIGYYAATLRDDGNFSVVQALNGSNGKEWYMVTLLNGGILKIVSGTTMRFRNDAGPIFPNLTEGDFDGGKYIGKDRYYKFTNIKTNVYSVLDVTSDFEGGSSGTNTPTYNLNQNVFGDMYNQGGGYPYLLLGELVQDNIVNKFGGDSDTAIQQNLWIPSSEPIDITSSDNISIPFQYGDTWYARYDCLKTYPFTQEDENAIVEIGSFMCETRINIDGRYDRNRGQLSNLQMTPQNFNLFNQVYSQKDNFFNYRIYEDSYYNINKFINQVTWSTEKSPGGNVDSWSSITMSSVYNMDGDKGEITSLKTWNDTLLCFQQRALSQILFNSRVQIPTSDNNPIEISNNYKVTGKRVLSDIIGCNNKWSIAVSPNGVYFIDSNTEDIYRFNGNIDNLSTSKGMKWWVKQSNSKELWNPIPSNNNGIRAFYDYSNGDIYFSPGPSIGKQQDALCYSESLDQFTSLMSYGGVQAMFNYSNSFCSLKELGYDLNLYQNNKGEYNNFFGELKGWDFSFISNDNSTRDKIFDTINFRGDKFYHNLSDIETSSIDNYNCPVNFIKVENEYQDTNEVKVDNYNMKKKFRIWRGIIPRNYGTMNRIRNPWTMITLGWRKEYQNNSDTDTKAVIHDIFVKYTMNKG